jgi:hypothetical protein
MKDDVNDEVPNGTPKILVLSNGVLNLDEVTSQKETMLHIYEVGYKCLCHKIWSKSGHMQMI